MEKTDRAIFIGRIPRILEEGWRYLAAYFTNEDQYFTFLENISKDKFEDFLYTIYFYYVHDLYRITGDKAIVNIDGFMYQITLSIIEHLNNDKTKSVERIKDFIKYFSSNDISTLNEAIMVQPLNGVSIRLEFWEILYDMRNGFIHDAHWFNLIDQDSGAFASLSLIKHRNKDGTYTEYLGDIRIKFQEYLRLFWGAYLKYFGKN